LPQRKEKQSSRVFLNFSNDFVVFGNDFVVFDEHNQDMLIHKATIHEQQQHPLRAQPACTATSVQSDQRSQQPAFPAASVHSNQRPLRDQPATSTT